MPFLFPLIGLLAGILLGYTFRQPALGLVPLSAASLVYLIILKRSSGPSLALRLNRWHRIWIVLLFCGIGTLDMGFHNPETISSKELERYVLAEGEIKESKSFTSGDRFIVSVSHLVDSLSKVRTSNDFRVILYTPGLSANVGDIVTFPAKFQLIADNPNLRPSGFTERMNRSGIFYRVYANEGDLTVTGYHNSIFNNASRWRDSIVARLEKSSVSRPVCDFISALLLGDRSFLSEEVHNAFSNAGVAHVLALSGLHVSILMGLVLFILFPFKLTGMHTVRYVLAVILLWVFVFVTGLAPSTIRAAVMTTFVVTASLLQRRNSPENALLAAVFLILLVNPRSIFDVGLQLSVLCVGSILFFASRLNPMNRRSHPVLYSLAAALLVSMLATASTWMVICYYFNSVPLLFLPVNLCLLPLLPAYVWIASVYILLLAFGLDISFLSAILNIGYDCFDWIVASLSYSGRSAVSLEIPLPVLALWLSGILIFAFALKVKTYRKKIWIAGGSCLMTLSLVLIPFLKQEAPDSIIFQKNYKEINLALYEGNLYHISSMPRNTVSRIEHKGVEILSIDTRIEADTLKRIILDSRGNNYRKKYLILGGGFNGMSLKELPFITEYEKIILHSSLKRKMENKLCLEALELGITTLHSLREDGALEEILPESLPESM